MEYLNRTKRSFSTVLQLATSIELEGQMVYWTQLVQFLTKSLENEPTVQILLQVSLKTSQQSQMELVPAHVFSNIPGHAHSSFVKYKNSITSPLNTRQEEFITWMRNHLCRCIHEVFQHHYLQEIDRYSTGCMNK